MFFTVRDPDSKTGVKLMALKMTPVGMIGALKAATTQQLHGVFFYLSSHLNATLNPLNHCLAAPTITFIKLSL